MNYILVLTALLIAGSQTGSNAAPVDTTAVRMEITNTLQQFHQAMMSNDRNEMSSMMSDDILFMGTDPDEIMNKKETMGMFDEMMSSDMMKDQKSGNKDMMNDKDKMGNKDMMKDKDNMENKDMMKDKDKTAENKEWKDEGNMPDKKEKMDEGRMQDHSMMNGQQMHTRNIKIADDGKSAITVEQFMAPMISKTIPVRLITHMKQSSDGWKFDFVSWNMIPVNEDLPVLDKALENKGNGMNQ